MLNGQADMGMSGHFAVQAKNKQIKRLSADLRRKRPVVSASPELQEAWERNARFKLREQIARRCIVRAGQPQKHAA
ncbi:MAG: hypothetical protein HRT94_00925 [Alphaproteobacteria bacterium]|nr:hypothetical protein [Alphaproteobacteria bacterium]